MPLIMGILNCTPDSFSDGGKYLTPSTAVAHALKMRDEGAFIIDVGAESSRPGAAPISVEQELQRLLPVLSALRKADPDLRLSVDTSKPEVVEACIPFGISMVNDIRGGAAGVLSLVARWQLDIVLMHMRGRPEDMQDDTTYRDVCEEVHAYLKDRAEIAMSAGIPRGKIWLDPGIGFGKDVKANLELLRSLPELSAMGFSVLLGTSRKSFIGRLVTAPVGSRLPGSLASLLPILGLGGTMVRVHDVAETSQFLQIASMMGVGQ